MFPADLGTKVAEAIPDIREAGKCLAFETNTAAGFHVLRANEAVLRRYWTTVTNGSPQPRNPNLGLYLKKMGELGVGNAKVISVLTQIKDLHRNPLMHPEETLNLDEAVGLFGIVRSSITAMLKEIPPPSSASQILLAPTLTP